MDTNSSVSFFQEAMLWFSQINVVLLIIILCSIVAFAVFFERLIYYKRMDIDTSALIIQIRKAVESQNIVEAMNICLKDPTSISNIVYAGLCKHEKSREHIESAMQVRGLIEIAKMEKNARILSIIAHIAPLIGLLGTVLGFIKAFSEMRISSLVEISATQIGEAMEYALVTTAAGLVVAIPCAIAYNYLVSRIDHMTVEMHATASEVVDLIDAV